MATNCGNISANLAINCDTPLQAGTADRAIVINFDDIASVVRNGSNPQIIEDIILNSGASAFQIDGKNNSIEPDDALVKQRYAEVFDHHVRMKGFDISPTGKKQLNSMVHGRFVVITENRFKGASGNAAFEVRGLGAGLVLTELTRNPNDQDTQGAFDLLFSTDEFSKETVLPNTLFITSYAASKAVVDALL